MIPLINGVAYAWSNLTWMWYTLPLIGIKSISYEAKQKTELGYGAGVYPVVESHGNYEYKGEIEIYLDEWNKIIKAAPNNDPLQIPRYDMQTFFGGSRVAQKVDILRAVKFMNDPMHVKQNDGSIIVKIELSIAGIDHV